MLKRSEIERKILEAQKEAASLFRGNGRQAFEADLARWRATGENSELVAAIDAGLVILLENTAGIGDEPYSLVRLEPDDLNL